MRSLGPVSNTVPILLLAAVSVAQEGEEYRPPVAPASSEGSEAIVRFEVPDGFEVRLFAAEPHLANPVAFTMDYAGRMLVAETFRHFKGVTDIREHMDWLDDDLANRTVEDRVAMIRKHERERFEFYTRDHERVRLLEDTDGDGLVDRATVFADGFNDPAAGIGAGLLVRKGEVYYTCIPDLWRLRDTDGDGVADERERLHTGFGVNVALLGHDLHGLVAGPDGRLYFSVGDRGFHVVTHEGETLAHPHTGAVLRCNWDGSGLEVFATGLRNPQELVFDDHGNLFTGDNNSDGGDRARWVYVVEGSDAGWRYSYQWITRPNLRGPWNAERLWHPQHEGQPAYHMPPIRNFADGPSGLTRYPGSGMPEEWQGFFFLCDFRGEPSISGVHAFRNVPKGAGFELVDETRFLWGSLVTDVDFGPEGALYVTDWVSGWNTTGKGRAYRIGTTDAAAVAAGRATAKLLAAGMEGRRPDELARLLRHADRRVRQEAQFELAARVGLQGDAGFGALAHLAAAAASGETTVTRLHGIWALGQVVDRDSSVLGRLFALLEDPDAEVRCQALRILGEHAYGFAGVRARLADPDPRVAFFAAQAIGKYGSAVALPDLFDLLARNADADPYVRHACVHALAAIGNVPGVLDRCADADVAVRRGALLVLRKWADPAIARFLADPDPALVAEAARAIYDVPIEGALPALARALEEVAGDDVYLMRRMLHANLRAQGGAERIAGFVARRSAPEPVLVEALELLAGWRAPAPRDGIVGEWRPFAEERDVAGLAGRALELAAPVLASASAPVLRAWIGALGALDSTAAAPVLTTLLEEERLDGDVRAAALGQLAAWGAADAGRVRAALVDEDEDVRVAAFRLLGGFADSEALPLLASALESGPLACRQAAMLALGERSSAAAAGLVAGWLERLASGSVPTELHFELLSVARGSDDGRVRQLLAAWEANAPADDPLAAWRDCLAGGDAQAGRSVFFENAEVGCLRCHQVGQHGGDEVGGQVGPELTLVGSRLGRRELLESVLRPDAVVAEGFESWILLFDDSTPVAGRILSEADGVLTLATKDGEEVEYDLERVTARRRDVSAMPADVSEKLSRAEVRDLVEYLASLRGAAPDAGD